MAMNDNVAASKRMRREMMPGGQEEDPMDTDRLAADSLGYAKEALSILQELSNRRHHLSGLTKPVTAAPQQDARQTPRKVPSRTSTQTPRNLGATTPRDKPFTFHRTSDSHLRSYGNPLFDLLNNNTATPPASPIPDDAPYAAPDLPHDAAADPYPSPTASPASARKVSSLARSRDMSTKASRLRAQSTRLSADSLGGGSGAPGASGPTHRASERVPASRHAAVLAELEAAKQREACLAQQLSRAHAEVLELKGQLDHQRALSKELAAAGRAAREALGKMADQNARLVTAYISTKQQLHALQGKHHPGPHEPYSDASTDSTRPHSDSSESETEDEDEGQADSDDSATTHSHSHHSHHSPRHHHHPFYPHPHHAAAPHFATPPGAPSPHAYHPHHAATPHPASTPSTADPYTTPSTASPYPTPSSGATYPTPSSATPYPTPDGHLLHDHQLPQYMRPTEGLESHPCKGLDTESDTAQEAFTGLSSMSISDGASVGAPEEAVVEEVEDLLAAAAAAAAGGAVGAALSPRSRELAEARRQARVLQEQNEQLLLAQQEAERLRLQMERMQEAERLKQEGNRAYARQQHADAIAAYGRALSLEPLTPALRAILHCNRAAALHSTGAYADAISDCFQALHLDPSYARPLQRRADAYCALGDYTAAAADLRHACDEQPANKELLQRLWDMQHKARTAPLVNHYAVLGLASTASLSEIKSAYRKLALKYHPDKATNAGEQAAAAVLFRLISTAHATLTSPDKRKAFDAARLRRKLRRSTFQV